jgi:hypothetical protein
MPLLRKGVVLPVKGIDFSVPATFIGDQYGFPKNMQYFRGQMMKGPGKTAFGVNAASQIMGLTKLEIFSGIKYLVRASKTRVQKWNTTTSIWDNISTAMFTGDDDDFFSFTNVVEDGLLLISNYVQAVQKWNGSGAVSALGGTPPKAKFMTYVSPYVLLGYTNDGNIVSPWNVQWCDTGTPEVWSGGNAGARLLSDEASPLQNIMRLNEGVVGYKKKSIWMGNKVDTTEVFHFDCVKTGMGLGASRAVADYPDGHLFMSEDDFFSFSGIRPESIGGPVRDEVFGKIDRSKINRCFAVQIQQLSEVWFFIVVTGNEWPTEIWKYNYRSGFWYYDTCDAVTAAIAWERITSMTWDDDSGSWDSDLNFWDYGDSSAQWEQIVFGNSIGRSLALDFTTADDDGNAVEGIFETKDFSAETLEKNKRWLQLDVWARGSKDAKLYVDYSIDHGDTWKNIPLDSSKAYITLTEKVVLYHIYLDVFGDQIRFRFRNKESGEVFAIESFYPYYLSKEQKR